MDSNSEIDDQASVVGGLFGLHLKNHPNGEPDPNCTFCKGFIIPGIESKHYPFESYEFILFDVNENKTT